MGPDGWPGAPLGQGSEYLSIRYTERLAEAGAVTSVGSHGDSFDNALTETIIGLYKTELIRRRGPWKGLDQLEYATLEWVDWFNHRRLLEPIGHVPPAELRPPTIEGRRPAALLDSRTQASTEPGRFKLDVYSHVIPGMDAAAANAVVSLILAIPTQAKARTEARALH